MKFRRHNKTDKFQYKCKCQGKYNFSTNTNTYTYTCTFDACSIYFLYVYNVYVWVPQAIYTYGVSQRIVCLLQNLPQQDPTPPRRTACLIAQRKITTQIFKMKLHRKRARSQYIYSFVNICINMLQMQCVWFVWIGARLDFAFAQQDHKSRIRRVCSRSGILDVIQ